MESMYSYRYQYTFFKKGLKRENENNNSFQGSETVGAVAIKS